MISFTLREGVKRMPGWAERLPAIPGSVLSYRSGLFRVELGGINSITIQVSELVMVDFSGQMNSFYVSLTGCHSWAASPWAGH